jgi:hypothetical protein
MVNMNILKIFDLTIDAEAGQMGGGGVYQVGPLVLVPALI